MTRVYTEESRPMNVPEWLLEILKQFPGLAAGLAVGWYVVRLISRVYENQIEQIRKDNTEHLATKDGVIARLVTEIEGLKKERDKWLKEAIGKGKS